MSPRHKIAALWTSVLFVFAYVDLFSLYREDMRADLDAGKVSQFDVGGAFLLGVTMYIVVPSVLIALSLLMSATAVRWSNLVVAVLYLPTIIASAVGEWGYFVLGSATEAVLLVVIVRIAWSWPRTETAGKEFSLIENPH